MIRQLVLLGICIGNTAVAAESSPFVSKFQQQQSQRLNYYQAKAFAGDPHAQFKLGWAYETGDGLPQDTNAASRWYQKAARQGHRNAQLNLRTMAPGDNLTLSPEEQAFMQMYAQAYAGDDEARLTVAREAVNGSFNRPELMQIYAWLKQQSQLANSESQHLLGLFYVQGRGVPQNFVRAYAWFSVAAATGHGPALASRDAVANLMSAQQLEQAQALSMQHYETVIENIAHPIQPGLDASDNVTQAH